jgi:hypothetical protein
MNDEEPYGNCILLHLQRVFAIKKKERRRNAALVRNTK